MVGPTHPMEHSRTLQVLDGPVDEQVEAAVRALVERGALTVSATRTPSTERPRAERRPATVSSPSCSSRAAPRWAPSSSGRRPAWPRSSAARSRCWRRARAAAEQAETGGRRPLRAGRLGAGGRRGGGRDGVRPRAPALGPARPEHRVRPGGGGPGGRGHRFGSGRRRRGAVGLRRRHAGGGQTGLRRCAGGRHHLPQRHLHGHGPSGRPPAAGAGPEAAPAPATVTRPVPDARSGPAPRRAPQRRRRDAGPGRRGHRRGRGRGPRRVRAARRPWPPRSGPSWPPPAR